MLRDTQNTETKMAETGEEENKASKDQESAAKK